MNESLVCRHIICLYLLVFNRDSHTHTRAILQNRPYKIYKSLECIWMHLWIVLVPFFPWPESLPHKQYVQVIPNRPFRTCRILYHGRLSFYLLRLVCSKKTPRRSRLEVGEVDSFCHDSFWTQSHHPNNKKLPGNGGPNQLDGCCGDLFDVFKVCGLQNFQNIFRHKKSTNQYTLVPRFIHLWMSHTNSEKVLYIFCQA